MLLQRSLNFSKEFDITLLAHEFCLNTMKYVYSKEHNKSTHTIQRATMLRATHVILTKN